MPVTAALQAWPAVEAPWYATDPADEAATRDAAMDVTAAWLAYQALAGTFADDAILGPKRLAACHEARQEWASECVLYALAPARGVRAPARRPSRSGARRESRDRSLATITIACRGSHRHVTTDG
jgi:hypothetical protein